MACSGLMVSYIISCSVGTPLQTEISFQILDGLVGIFIAIPDPQKKNPNDFGNPLTFYLVPPASSGFQLYSETSVGARSGTDMNGS